MSRARRRAPASSPASRNGGVNAPEPEQNLLRGEPCGVNDPMPPCDVLADERTEAVARGRHRKDHLRYELRLDCRRAEDVRNLLVQIIDDGRGRACGRVEAEPEREIEILDATLGEGRDIGQLR